MKRRDAWMTFGLGLALSSTGCGAGGAGADEFTSGISGSKPIGSLSDSEVGTLCDDETKFLSQSAFKADSCRLSAFVAAVLSAALSSGSTDAELRMACSDAYDQCLNEAPSVKGCDGSSASTKCTATVSELGACLEDGVARAHALASDVPDCNSLTTADVTATSGMQTSSMAGKPKSCQTLETKCQGTSDADTSSPDGPVASVPLGDECRGYAECAPVAGKTIECRCTDQSKKPICVADAEVGESCALTGNFQPVCRPGTVCSGSSPVMTEASCMVPAAAGEACGNDLPLCQDPYYCDSTFHCVLGQAALGAACDRPWDAFCAVPNICGVDAGVCTAPAAVGQPCFFGDRNPCVAGAACAGLTGTCEPLKPDGADCAFDVECSSGICSLDQCGSGSLPSNVNFGCGF